MTSVGASSPLVPNGALPGLAAGAALGTAVAVGGMTRLAFPAPVGVAAGAMIGGPIAAISLMNNRGESNSLLGSALIGAAPLALAGAGLGWFGSGWDGGKVGVGIATGAITLGLVGAGIGAITHGLTNGHD